MAHEFETEEVVLCLSNTDSIWYRAKIIEKKVQNGGNTLYKVHYHGWAASWDEWVSDHQRLEKGSSDKTICDTLLNEKNKNIIKPRDIDMAQTTDDGDEGEEPAEFKRNGVVFILPLSPQIKDHLIKQFEFINCNAMHQRVFIKLPKRKHLTINGICNEFIQYQSNKIDTENMVNPKEEKQYLRQIMWSIAYYFNVFIDINILFKSEKKQKTALMKKYCNMNSNQSTDFCDIYGAEHLFRLLYNIQTIYNNIKHMTPLQASKISCYVSLFGGFLTKNIQNICVEFDIYNDKNKKNDGLIIKKLKQKCIDI